MFTFFATRSRLGVRILGRVNSASEKAHISQFRWWHERRRSVTQGQPRNLSGLTFAGMGVPWFQDQFRHQCK